jgi:hypothetical protein
MNLRVKRLKGEVVMVQLKGVFRCIVVLAAALIAAPSVWADIQARVITLKDGTQIQGKLRGVNNGVYIVESATLGVLHLKEGDVQSIGEAAVAAQARPSALPAAVAAGKASPADLQAVQSSIMSNPNLMADIQSIAGDPEIVALISDPEFMQAVQSRNVAALSANPRMAKLMENPKIRALIGKIQGTGGQ